MAQTGVDLTRTAEELLDAFNRSDWDKMRAMVAPDVVYIETGTGRRIEGADAYIELGQTWKRAFPDTTGTIRNMLVVGDIVAQELRWESTHTGPLETPNGTIEATNKRVATDASHWTRFDGGLARELHHYIDVFSLLGRSAPCRSSRSSEFTTTPPPPTTAAPAARGGRPPPDAPPPMASHRPRATRENR